MYDSDAHNLTHWSLEIQSGDSAAAARQLEGDNLSADAAYTRREEGFAGGTGTQGWMVRRRETECRGPGGRLQAPWPQSHELPAVLDAPSTAFSFV